jgi:hypothetical protein
VVGRGRRLLRWEMGGIEEAGFWDGGWEVLRRQAFGVGDGRY